MARALPLTLHLFWTFPVTWLDRRVPDQCPINVLQAQLKALLRHEWHAAAINNDTGYK